jgi:hypothetical protein
MKLLKSLPAALAAGALTLAQPALALANHNDDGPTDEIGAPKASEPLVFLLIIVAAAVAAGLIFEHNDHPHSP